MRGDLKMDYNQAINYLNCQPGASISDIKKAYRDLAKKYHPDAGGTHEQFIQLQNARDAALRGNQGDTYYGFSQKYAQEKSETISNDHGFFIAVNAFVWTLFAILSVLLLPWSAWFQNLYLWVQTITQGEIIFTAIAALIALKVMFDICRRPSQALVLILIIIAAYSFMPDIRSQYHLVTSTFAQFNDLVSQFNQL